MEAVMPLISWIHVSDIHFGHKDHKIDGDEANWDQEMVLEEILNDVRGLHRKLNVPKPSMILVTGDIAFSGAAEQYSKATAWLSRLQTMFDIQDTGVFIVPGNHDLDRNVAKSAADVADAIATARERGLSDNLTKAVTDQRFSAYSNFANKFQHCNDPQLWTQPVNTWLQLIGVNTALLSQDEKDEGALSVTGQMLNRIRALRNPRIVSVIMTHHPLEWLRAKERQKAKAAFRGAIHLYGHVHEAGASSWTEDGDPSYVSIVAGASHAEDERLPGGERKRIGHGYNFSLLCRSRDQLCVRVWHRTWVDKRRIFAPHTELSDPHETYQTISLGTPPDTIPKFEDPPQQLTTQRLLDYTPTHIYPATHVGFSSSIVNDFNSSLSTSSFYYYKGDAAQVTSVQLLKLIESGRAKVTDARFMLAKPTKAVLKQRFEAEGISATEELTRRTERLIDEVLTSIVGFQLIHERHPSVTITVGFFSEEPFQRVEITRNDVFVTMYRLGGQFGTTLRYSDSSKVYEALHGHFLLSSGVTKYPERLLEDAFSEMLNRGATDHEVLFEKYRKRWDERVDKFSGQRK